MCDPVTIAVIGIASAGVSTYAQHQTAKAQADAIGAQQEHETEEATAAAEEKLGAAVKAGRESRARARVAAGESGVGGASFAASINQSLQDQDMDAALISKNLSFSHRGIQDRASSALASIRDPSALEAGLNIASAGVQGYNTGLGIQARRKEAKT